MVFVIRGQTTRRRSPSNTWRVLVWIWVPMMTCRTPKAIALLAAQLVALTL